MTTIYGNFISLTKLDDTMCLISLDKIVMMYDIDGQTRLTFENNTQEVQESISEIRNVLAYLRTVELDRAFQDACQR